MSLDTKNSPKRIVVVGGVAGGMSAATRLRRLLEDAHITVLERSGYVSFANCGLPYHVGGVIEYRDALMLQTPESLNARFDLDVRVLHEVTDIDAAARTVSVTDEASGESYSLDYDALILSPGARPVRPPIPGIERALSLRDIEDTDTMVAAVKDAHTAVVIGGGFIGLELAENLKLRGMDVTIVEASSQVMAPLDPEMAQLVTNTLRFEGIEVILNASATAINESHVELSDGHLVPADFVAAAIGVKPDTSLAEKAGLRLGTLGAIAVDRQMRTSDPHIWAVGDAVEKTLNDDRPALVPLAGPANRQGRLAADAIAGLDPSDPPVLGTAIVGIVGLQVAATGLNEKTLRQQGRRYRAIHTMPMDHAGYYPGANEMFLKLLIDPDTDEILGAQGVGRGGVDKRIDVLATAIRGKIPASELIDLDLTYSPQFGSAKDPVNMLGYLADNYRQGMVESIQWHELPAAAESGSLILDVRTEGEVRNNPIGDVINIPVDELRKRMHELDTDRDYIVACAVGQRAYTATRQLLQNGYQARLLDGGVRTLGLGAQSSQA